MLKPMSHAQLVSAKHGLGQLCVWLDSGFFVKPLTHTLDAAMLRENAMPPSATVWDQFELLHGKLQAASSEPEFKRRWEGASGTVIMKDVFTRPRFYNGVDAYLYVFQQCATKTMCEAVVEGMASVWKASAPGLRHPSFAKGSEEAVIAWSAPQPYHQEAVPFINHALNHCFGRYTDGPLKGQLKRWDFTHHDAHHTSRTPAQPGVVMGRHRSEPLRLPSSAYDVPAN
jgi:hypothetical protein